LGAFVIAEFDVLVPFGEQRAFVVIREIDLFRLSWGLWDMTQINCSLRISLHSLFFSFFVTEENLLWMLPLKSFNEFLIELPNLKPEFFKFWESNLSLKFIFDDSLSVDFFKNGVL
jgi:hypothetical protein